MLYDKLYDYQKEIFNKEKDKKSHALFMDMGTGKTITSLSLFENSHKKKLLIICVVSKLQDWYDEINNYFDLKCCILNKGTTKNKELLNNNSDCYIVGFESCWRLDRDLLKLINKDWYIIVDESHKIKNTKSKIGKFANRLRLRTDTKCILTGTPQNQGYIDYFNQLKFIDVLDISELLFKNMYCIFDYEYFNGQPIKQLKGYKNITELNDIINNNCIFFKRDISNDMIPQDIYVNIDKHKSYDKFRKTKVYEDILGDSQSSLRVGLRELCSGFIKDIDVSHIKLEWLCDFFDSYNERIVIFYNFNKEAEYIKNLCIKLKRPYSMYNGNEKNLDNFKTYYNGIAICNYASASLGLNDLVLSNVCIMYSPTEDYINFTQSRKRIDRIGQTKKPLFYYLQTRNSIEIAIYNALKNGKSFDDKMFNNYLENSV